jgi:type II secretory pathway component PulF
MPVLVHPAPPNRTGPHDLKPSRRSDLLRAFLQPFLADARLASLIAFHDRLAVLLKAGIPLARALRTVEEQCADRALAAAAGEMRAAAEAGGSVSDVMRRRPAIFSEMQAELVRAGEEGGFLEAAFARAADYLRREQELRRFLSRQMLYGKIVLFGALFAFPVMMAIAFGGNPLLALARPTLALLLLATLVGMGSVAWECGLSRSAAFPRLWEQVRWSLPGIGKVARNTAMVRFCRAFAALWGAGASLTASLEAAGRASGSPRMMAVAREAVRASAVEGRPLSETLERSGLLPAPFVGMLRTAELTGSLDALTTKMADYLEDETRARAHVSAYVFSQTFFAFIGIYVILTVL